MPTYFTDQFGLDPAVLEEYGAFNVSLVADLPLFIDPFLLFHSDDPEYQALHEGIIRYLVFLKDKAVAGGVVDKDLLKAWYCFPEVKQTWLGFSLTGNSGSGLGVNFATALHSNLHRIFSDFGSERVTKGSHLEKVCLIREGVGRDNISDFTTNLILGWLCEFTQRLAKSHLRADQIRRVAIHNARFNYHTEAWETGHYELPWASADYVILTPKDILTRDDTWINKHDLVTHFEDLPAAMPDGPLRAQVSNYFQRAIPRHRDKEPTHKELDRAAAETILQFPELIDYYIRYKEDHGEDAENLSLQKVYFTEQVFIRQMQELQGLLLHLTPFYLVGGNTHEEAHTRLAYLKDVIENKGGHRIFYSAGRPLQREQDLHVLYRLVWIGTPSDVSTEVNDGRGPADYKISRGARDKTIVEMKLAKNTHLKKNLERQAEVYQRASDAKGTIKVILFFTAEEEIKVKSTLRELGLLGHQDVVLIDARNDNKPSGSVA
jgi:hypothetical protein